MTTAGGAVHDVDETVRPSTKSDGLASLMPSFVDEDMAARFPQINWSITPGNSSPLTDGASAALIMGEDGSVILTKRLSHVGSFSKQVSAAAR